MSRRGALPKMPSAPSTPYPCRPAESKAIGRAIPGRRGGVITGCATPSEKHPRERQWWLGLPVVGFGQAVRKSTAARRIRNAGKPVGADPIDAVAYAAASALAGERIPHPPGLEFPHVRGSSRCDPEHRVWSRYLERLEAARETAAERAALEISEDASDDEYQAARERFTVEDLERDRQYGEWIDTSVTCARNFETRQAARRGKAQFSTQRERGQARARAIASGEDVTAAEYLDTLRSRDSGAKKKKRR